MLALANLLESTFGHSGALLAIAIGGLADAQSAAVSAAALATAGKVSADTAALGVLLALSTNTVSKAIVALAIRGRGQVLRMWTGLLAIVCAAWAGYALQSALV